MLQNSKLVRVSIAALTLSAGWAQADSNVFFEKRYETDVNFEEQLPIEATGDLYYRQGKVDFGTELHNITRLCFIPYSEETAITSSKLGTTGYSLNLNANAREPYCRTKGSLGLVFEAYEDGKEDISVYVKYGSISRYKVIAYTEGKGGSSWTDEIYIDAIDNALWNFEGQVKSHSVEPGVTYEIALVGGDGSFGNDTNDKFANVGISYVNSVDNRMTIATIGTERTFVTTKGEINFFFVDNPELNEGGLTVGLKKVNLE